MVGVLRLSDVVEKVCSMIQACATPRVTDSLEARDGNRILVVDDEENMLVLLKRVLGKEGYQVECAESGKRASVFLKRTSSLWPLWIFPCPGWTVSGSSLNYGRCRIEFPPS